MKSTIVYRAIVAFAFISASAAQAAPEFKLTGFVKAAMTGSDRSANTFGNDTLAAPTSARPTGLTGASDGGELTFQTAQTRIGLLGQIEETTRAIVEFDFYDATKASPTTGSTPRVRIAKIDHKLSDTLNLTAGQDWDVFAPLNIFSYNYVGNNFQAGNGGFMRQQVILASRHDNVEYRYALGMVGQNNAAAGDLERTALPSAAFSVAFGTAPNRWGVSALVGRINMRSGNDRAYRDVNGLNLFAETVLGSTSIRSELYYGKNLENAGALTLSRGTFAKDLSEVGGFVSARQALSEKTGLFGTIGYAQVLNPDDLVPLTVGATSPFLGLKQNLGTKLGADYKLSEKLTTFCELSQFHSLYAGLDTADAVVFDIGLNLAL